MMKKMLFSVGMILALGFSGCIDHPFAPVAVPVRYHTMPDDFHMVDAEDHTGELLVLQNLEVEPYRIAPGDEFSFFVYEHPELHAPSILVHPDGSLTVPLAGNCQVGGLTIDE